MKKGGEGIVASMGDESQPIKFRQIGLLFTVPYLYPAAKPWWNIQQKNENLRNNSALSTEAPTMNQCNQVNIWLDQKRVCPQCPHHDF